MTERIIDLAESAAYLRVQNRQLIIERRGVEPVSTPLSEVAAVIASHPQVQCSIPMLADLMEAGGAVIVCNDQCLPVGMMLPLTAHSVQTERFSAQAAAALPVKKRLWKQIVRRKIDAQAALLTELRGDDHGLGAIARSVRSGDPSNREAVASRRYWPALFDDPNFRRRFDAPDANRFLNYGYAVLRAVVGRAICAAGLHPSLGLHHHNRYNPFCLADDLMEPYRPLVDAAVVEHVGCFGQDAPLDSSGKQALLGAILKRYRADGEVRTLFDIVSRTAVSLARVFLRQSRELEYPNDLSDASS
jgi:CRISPR-associated protein Cas1